jgi:hypothetical protein
MVTLPATLCVGLGSYRVIDNNEISSAASYGSPDADRKVLTTAARGPRIYRTLVACDTEPKALLLRKDKGTNTPAEMFGQAKRM